MHQDKPNTLKTQPSSHLKNYNHPLNKYKKIVIRNIKSNINDLSSSTKHHLKQKLAQDISNNKDFNNLLKVKDNKEQVKTISRKRINTQSNYNNQINKKQRLNYSTTQKKITYKQYKSLESNDKNNPQKKRQRYQVPGPGKYLHTQLSRMNRTSYSFSKSKKYKQSLLFYQQKQRLPGPGLYHVKDDKFTNKNIIFFKAQQNKQIQKSPGPSHYKKQRSLLRHNGGIINKEKRLFQYKSQGPGPAAYKQVSINLVKSKSKIAIIGNNIRMKDEINVSPGPSYYKKQLRNSKDKIIVGVISLSPRMPINTQSSKIPSSLSYNPSYKNILKKESSAIMGTQARFPQADNIPFLQQITKQQQKSNIKMYSNGLLNDVQQMNKTLSKYSIQNKVKKSNLSDVLIQSK